MLKSKRKKKAFYIAITLFALLCIGLTIVAISYVKSGSKKDYEKKIELGNRYLTELDYESAIAVFEEVIEIEPNCVDAYMGLAQAYTESGKYEEAISILDAAIEKTESEELIIYREEVLRLQEGSNLSEDQALTETDNNASDERNAAIKMPDFRGCSESYAVEKIKELGFVATVEYEFNGRITSGNVISQNIEPESELPENAKIELLVSMGTPRITLDQNEIEIHPGESIMLQAQFVGEETGQFAVTWKSDNENVATVDVDGNVTAYAQGECNISATVGNEYSGYDTQKCSVIVKEVVIEQAISEGEVDQSETDSTGMQDNTFNTDNNIYVYDAQTYAELTWRYHDCTGCHEIAMAYNNGGFYSLYFLYDGMEGGVPRVNFLRSKYSQDEKDVWAFEGGIIAPTWDIIWDGEVLARNIAHAYYGID